MSESNKFAVFILTHGRPDSVVTDRSLRESGYTGEIHYIVDNEDKTIDRYIERFGKDRVHVFDKKAMSDRTDEGDNFENRRTIIHARNASWDVAEKIGVDCFIELDDDYVFFEWKTNKRQQYPAKMKRIKKNLDRVLQVLVDFYLSGPWATIAMAQGGDFIGGSEGPVAKDPKILRKCMNSFICSTKRRFYFVGSFNEDVNTYTALGARGALLGTVPLVSLTQKQTQSQSGGMTESYKKFGTYVKSFYTVMFAPSCVRVSMMHTSQARLHHSVNWKNAVPVIIREKHRKSHHAQAPASDRK